MSMVSDIILGFKAEEGVIYAMQYQVDKDWVRLERYDWCIKQWHLTTNAQNMIQWALLDKTFTLVAHPHIMFTESFQIT